MIQARDRTCHFCRIVAARCSTWSWTFLVISLLYIVGKTQNKFYNTCGYVWLPKVGLVGHFLSCHENNFGGSSKVFRKNVDCSVRLLWDSVDLVQLSTWWLLWFFVFSFVLLTWFIVGQIVHYNSPPHAMPNLWKCTNRCTRKKRQKNVAKERGNGAISALWLCVLSAYIIWRRYVMGRIWNLDGKAYAHLTAGSLGKTKRVSFFASISVSVCNITSVVLWVHVHTQRCQNPDVRWRWHLVWGGQKAQIQTRPRVGLSPIWPQCAPKLCDFFFQIICRLQNVLGQAGRDT